VTDSHLGRAVDKGVLGLSALIREKAARVEMKRTVFVLLGVIAVAPAWAHTLGDNSVIDSYRKYQVAAETPESNFMSDANQRHGPGTPDDNFMRETAMREDSDSYLDNQSYQLRRNRGSFYLDETDQDDP
jgi:hypothetical protein